MGGFNPYEEDLAVWLKAQGAPVLTIALARELARVWTVCWYSAPHDRHFVVGMLVDLARVPKRYPVHDDGGALMLFPGRLAAHEFLQREMGIECPNDFPS